jgi:hypothetical protein
VPRSFCHQDVKKGTWYAAPLMSNLTISDIAIRYPCTVDQVTQLYLACGDLDKVDFFCRLLSHGISFANVMWLIRCHPENRSAEDVLTMANCMSGRTGIRTEVLMSALRREGIDRPIEAVSKLNEWNEHYDEDDDVPPIRVIRVTKET